jgi:hypothetical protein
MKTIVRVDALEAIQGIVTMTLELTKIFEHKTSRLVALYVGNLINSVIESGDPNVLPGFTVWREAFEQTPSPPSELASKELVAKKEKT